MSHVVLRKGHVAMSISILNLRKGHVTVSNFAVKGHTVFMITDRCQNIDIRHC